MLMLPFPFACVATSLQHIHIAVYLVVNNNLIVSGQGPCLDGSLSWNCYTWQYLALCSQSSKRPADVAKLSFTPDWTRSAHMTVMYTVCKQTPQISDTTQTSYLISWVAHASPLAS